MRKLWVIVFAFLSSMAYAAELKTFTAGSPILASEINANYVELEARINALNAQVQSAGIPGEPFNYAIQGAAKVLPAGYKYYVTDIIFVRNAEILGCINDSRTLRVFSDISGDLIEVPATITHYQVSNYCVFYGSQLHLVTPILVNGGESLTHNFGTSTVNYPRIIGYRIAN